MLESYFTARVSCAGTRSILSRKQQVKWRYALKERGNGGHSTTSTGHGGALRVPSLPNQHTAFSPPFGRNPILTLRNTVLQTSTFPRNVSPLQKHFIKTFPSHSDFNLHSVFTQSMQRSTADSSRVSPCKAHCFPSAQRAGWSHGEFWAHRAKAACMKIKV